MDKEVEWLIQTRMAFLSTFIFHSKNMPDMQGFIQDFLLGGRGIVIHVVTQCAEHTAPREPGGSLPQEIVEKFRSSEVTSGAPNYINDKLYHAYVYLLLLS